VKVLRPTHPGKDQHDRRYGLPGRTQGLRQNPLWPLANDTFIAGLRHDGIIAPFVIDGRSMHEFPDYVVKVLVLELSQGIRPR